MSRIAKILALLVTIATLTACGTETDVRYVADYELHLNSSDEYARGILATVIDDFNTLVGREVVSLAPAGPTDGQRVSTLVLQDGLRLQAGNIGETARFEVSETAQRRMGRSVVSEKGVIRLGMDVALDRAYVDDRLDLSNDKARYRLQILVFHEIGHGLGLPHFDAVNDVMYYATQGEKDLEAFAARVRAVAP